MSLEWSVAGLLLAAALWPLLWKKRSWRARLGVLLLVMAAGFGGFTWKRANEKLGVRREFLEKIPSERESGGYVRAETCRTCHPDQYASWHRSSHRAMAPAATPKEVRGDFNNVTLTADDETFHLSRRGDAFFVEMVDPDWKHHRTLKERAFERGEGPEPEQEPTPPRVENRISLTTGSHHMQAYWVARESGNHHSLPFTYLFEESRWVPRNDVLLIPPDSPPKAQTWSTECVGCYTTAELAQQDARTLVLNTRVREYGIACESCHGPGDEHVRVNSDPRRRYALRRRAAADPTIKNPVRLSSKEASEICGQCHAARAPSEQSNAPVEGTEFWSKEIELHRPLLSGKDLKNLDPAAYPEQAAQFNLLSTYFWRDGMVRVSGREYNGLVETACFQRGTMSCLSCHSMHKMTSTDDQLARGMEGNQACYQCHDQFKQKLVQHTHHSASSVGSLCYNCHMPHTTYGLLKAVRSHQITSPTVKSSIDTGRPNACNLCHLDQPLAWSATHLEAWYGQPVPGIESDFTNTPAAAVWLLRGDAGQRALIAWHMGWEPAKRASGTNWLVPYLAETLDDPYSVVRYIGQRSLKRIPGFEHLDYDYIAPSGPRVRLKSEILQRWNSETLPASDRAKILLPEQISKLLLRRDHRRVELSE